MHARGPADRRKIRSAVKRLRVPIGVDLAGIQGGGMTSAEGGLVPRGWVMGREGVPSAAD